MKSSRSSGPSAPSSSPPTCSAEMIVPCTTSTSTPAASRVGVSSRACCGLTRAATVAPPPAIRSSASVSSAGCTGAACSRCSSATASAGSVGGAADHLGQRLLGLGVPCPQALGVEDAEPAELARPRRRWPGRPRRPSGGSAAGARSGRRRAARPSTPPTTSASGATGRCRDRRTRSCAGRCGPDRSRPARARGRSFLG